jgi:hypothetical protein
MLYQLSYASGAVARERASGKIGMDRSTVKARDPKRKGSRGKKGRNFLHEFPGCLFPRRQGVTGMNPTAFPASLTGRIWFFLCRTTDCNYCISDCFRPTCVPLTPFESCRRFFRRLVVGYEPQVIHHRTPYARFSGCGATRVAAKRRRRCRFALGPALVFRPLSPGRTSPQPHRPDGLCPRIRLRRSAWPVPPSAATALARRQWP